MSREFKYLGTLPDGFDHRAKIAIRGYKFMSQGGKVENDMVRIYLAQEDMPPHVWEPEAGQFVPLSMKPEPLRDT